MQRIKPTQQTAFVTVLLAVVCVSLSSIFVRLSTAPSLTLAFYRMAFAALLLLPVVLWRNRQELKSIKPKQLLLCILSGIFVACHFWLYFMSVHQTTISAATLLANLEVLFVAALMFFRFGERIAKINLIGIGITLLGSILLCCADGFSGGGLTGDLMALAAGFCMAIYTVIGRRMRSKENPLSTISYTFLVYASAAVTLAIISLCTQTAFFPAEDTGKNLWIGLGLAVFCTLLGHSIFSWGLKYLKAAIVSTTKLAEPVFATVCGIFLFAEIPSLLTICSGVILLIGVWLANKSESTQTK
jgi:drug/metabolite transporter (DMT)-like permease